MQTPQLGDKVRFFYSVSINDRLRSTTGTIVQLYFSGTDKHPVVFADIMLEGLSVEESARLGVSRTQRHSKLSQRPVSGTWAMIPQN
jgi:hypothetical protein